MNIARINTMTILLIGIMWGSLCFAQTEIKTTSRTIPQVPSATKINGIYYVTLDSSTPYGRGYQHGASLRYVIQKGVAQWKQWINETLGKQDVEIEIAEFIHDTDYLKGIRKHTPDLYEELQGISKGAGVDFQTLYAYQMFDELVVYVVKKYRLAHCSGFGVYGRDSLPNILGQNNDLPPYYAGTHTVLRMKYPHNHAAMVFTLKHGLDVVATARLASELAETGADPKEDAETRAKALKQLAKVAKSAKTAKDDVVGLLEAALEREEDKKLKKLLKKALKKWRKVK